MKTLLLLLLLLCFPFVGFAQTTSVPAQAVIVNKQTGTTYTVLNVDRARLVTLTNGSAIAVTLPRFSNGWYVWIANRGVGTVTITPSSGTIDGGATLVLTTNQGVLLACDGTNYFTGARGKEVALGTVTSVSGTTNQIDVATGTTTPVASLSATMVAPGTVTATTSVASPFFKSTNADPADAGAVRLGNNEFIEWEKATPGTDWTLGVNASDVLISNAPFSALTLTGQGLTSGRIPIAGTGGLLGDDADLTFATDLLIGTRGRFGTLQVGATAVINDATGVATTLQFGNGPSVVVPASADTYIYKSTSAAGSFPFDATGNLVYQSRSTSGVGGHAFLTGNTPTVKLAIANDGTVAISNLSTNGLVTTTGATGTLGVTVPGTGVLTALGVNVGTAGAFVVNGGAGGSPSSFGTMPAFTLGGTVSGGAQALNNIGSIGASNPGTGAFTTLTGTTVNGLTITNNGTNTLSITAGKTLTVLKTISLTAADDTGVYTLPTGTKTLLATDGAGTSLTGIPYTLTGTANQVVLSAGTGNITFSLPQSIATGSAVQFGTAGIGGALGTGTFWVHTNTNRNITIRDGGGTKTEITAFTDALAQSPIVITGSQYFFGAAPTTASGTPGSVCYATATLEILINNALTCTVSHPDSKKIDPDSLGSALDILMQIRPTQFAYKDNPARPRWGFLSTQLQSVDRRLGDGYDAKGEARSIDIPALLMINTQSIQELTGEFRSYRTRAEARDAEQQREIEELKRHASKTSYVPHY